ncbi:hypothetical protein EWM64_g5371 [Hericium alpestre]|uniref:Calcineurin-like phosphoesterase domain-containing protein n=1 Tax=Hericium alpestre TaxID=135208 RepID=A0A4Y9ZV14_9AGAM|nr:hypothetical protein EWM64_g5371 [Hericium alpestre]
MDRTIIEPLTEPYRSSIDECISKLEAFSSEVDKDESLGKFVYLNRTRYDVSPSLTILGCTLWSALNTADLDILSWSLNDFRRIDSFNPTAYGSLHRADLEWLNATVSSIAAEEPHRKIAIFTHHAPTVAGTGDPRFIGGPTNSAFATELTAQACWTAGGIVLWAFGHTHWSCDFVRDGCETVQVLKEQCASFLINVRGEGCAEVQRIVTTTLESDFLDHLALLQHVSPLLYWRGHDGHELEIADIRYWEAATRGNYDIPHRFARLM